MAAGFLVSLALAAPVNAICVDQGGTCKTYPCYNCAAGNAFGAAAGSIPGAYDCTAYGQYYN